MERVEDLGPEGENRGREVDQGRCRAGGQSLQGHDGRTKLRDVHGLDEDTAERFFGLGENQERKVDQFGGGISLSIAQNAPSVCTASAKSLNFTGFTT
jgi:hypothetical protein